MNNNYFPTINVYTALLLFITYTVVKIVYRLYLSPLSHIPGRKLAGTSAPLNPKPLDILALFILAHALSITLPNRLYSGATHLYAFYHDMIRRGLYIWEIEEMHKQYGKLFEIG